MAEFFERCQINFMVGNMSWMQNLFSKFESREEAGPGSRCPLQRHIHGDLSSFYKNLPPKVWTTSAETRPPKQGLGNLHDAKGSGKVKMQASYSDVDLLWSSPHSASRLGFHRGPQNYFEVEKSMGVGR